MDLLIAGDNPPGSYRILNLPDDRGSMGMASPQAPVGAGALEPFRNCGNASPHSIAFVGRQALAAANGATPLCPYIGHDGCFQLNGRSFSPNRVDTRVQLGSVEDWEI